MDEIEEIKTLNNYVLWVRFSDSVSGYIDVKSFISSGISTQLLDEVYFKKVKIDEFGGICWDNGFDFCPSFVKEILSPTNPCD